jgi:hypothetical protein
MQMIQKENRRPLYSILKSNSFCVFFIFVILIIGVYVYIITHINQKTDFDIIDHEAEMIERKSILSQTFQQIGRLHIIIVS